MHTIPKSLAGGGRVAARFAEEAKSAAHLGFARGVLLTLLYMDSAWATMEAGSLLSNAHASRLITTIRSTSPNASPQLNHSSITEHWVRYRHRQIKSRCKMRSRVWSTKVLMEPVLTAPDTHSVATVSSAGHAHIYTR